MIDSTLKSLSLRHQCRLLELNRSLIYYKPRPKNQETLLMNEIHELWMKYPFYGYRRVKAVLRRQGYEINGKKVRRLMKEMKLQAIYPKKRLSVRNPAHQKYPYLLRDLEINRPNMVWCTDITYIKMAKGFVYLMAIIDVYSRSIINWGLSTTMDTSFCLGVLQGALEKDKPTYLNTDQGSQFTSEDWIKEVEKAGSQVSMDGVGRWADNIPIERFWRSAKHESVFLRVFDSIKERRQEVGRYMAFYNKERPHQSLNYAVPLEVYKGVKEADAFYFKKAS